MSKLFRIVALFFIFLQQIPSISTNSGEGETDDEDTCPDTKTFQAIVHRSNDRQLISFSLRCTNENTVFEVKYTDGSLCGCGTFGNHSAQNDGAIQISCQSKLKMNFSTQISVDNVCNPSGDSCRFDFFIPPVVSRHNLVISPGIEVISSFANTQPSRDLVTLTRNPFVSQSTVVAIQQSPTVSIYGTTGIVKTGRNGSRCKSHFKNVMSMTQMNFNDDYIMSEFTVYCTSVTVFEVRYVNGKLCNCNKVTKTSKGYTTNCLNRLSSDAVVSISVPNVGRLGENCEFLFTYINSNDKANPLRITLTLEFPPETVSPLPETDIYNPTVLQTTVPSTQHSPVPSIQHSPVPSIQHSPVPSIQHSPVPSIKHSPVPSIQHSPVLSVQHSPVPSIQHSPVPSIKSSPVPSIPHSPVLATPSPSQKPEIMTSSIIEKLISSTSSFILKASPTTSEVLPSSTLSPEEREMKKLKEDADFINNLNTSAVNIKDEKQISRVLDAAVNLINTNLTIDDQEEDPGMQAVHVLQNLGNSISQQLDLGNKSSATFEEVKEDLIFGVAVVNSTASDEFSFPFDKSNTTGDEKIHIPSSVFVSDSGKSYFVGIIFKAYREMKNNTGDLDMGTKVINAIVEPPPSNNLSEPVEMLFKKNILNKTFAQECSFWIENNSLAGDHGRWSTRQCLRKFENKSHIRCDCSHLTNFAVLFRISNEKPSDEDAFSLAIITYIGLSLSILGCLLTFIIYISLQSIKSDRATIHTNLVVALGIADVIFLVTVIVNPDGDSCLACAMLAFFFYLAVFFWMLVEGVYIYLMVIKVFRGNVARRRRLAYLVGWGCPLIIAVITWAILRDDVVSKYHCWLSVDSGAIWAFVGPGLVIILANFIILLAVMKTTWATFVDDKEYGGLKSATKTFGAVIPILGITWVFGVMAFNESSIVFQYIFAITNSIQGALIFILYCIVNNEVRNELRRKFEVWQTRREVSSSTGGGRRTMYPYVVSSEKNTTFNRTTLSAQATPDLYRFQLSDVIESPQLHREEQKYSFETPNSTPEGESELETKEPINIPQDVKGDSENGRSSPVEMGKDSENKSPVEIGEISVGDDDAVDDSKEQV